MTFDKFIEKYNGGKWDFDGAYGSQCVDLFRFYNRDVLGIPQPKSVVGAKDFWGNYARDPIINNNFIKITNTPNAIPEKGNVVIWNEKVGSGFGHIAMAISGNINSFISLDQNWKGQGKTAKVAHNYNNIYGWFKPREESSQPSSEVFNPSRALPTSWYEIDEVKDAIKRGLIKDKDAWDTTITKFIELAKELNKQKAFYDEETEALIAQNKETEFETVARYSQTIEELEIRLASCLNNSKEKNMEEFPDYKKALIEGRRVFILAILGQLAITIPNWDVTVGYFASWGHFWQFLILPVLLAGFKAVVKYAQDKYGNGEYDKLIYKI